MRRLLWALVLSVICPTATIAVPLTTDEIDALCGQAEDEAHCGRLIEEVQLKRLPALAQRNGKSLVVALYPTGSASFVDSDDPVAGRAYSLWDSIDPMNAVVLYTTQGDNTFFTFLQRNNNRRIELPNEPFASPDRQRLLTIDFCESRCVNELAVWRVTKDGVKKELAWAPRELWSGASASWKDAETIVVDYAVGDVRRTVERKLSDPSWKRLPAT